MLPITHLHWLCKNTVQTHIFHQDQYEITLLVVLECYLLGNMPWQCVWDTLDGDNNSQYAQSRIDEWYFLCWQIFKRQTLWIIFDSCGGSNLFIINFNSIDWWISVSLLETYVCVLLLFLIRWIWYLLSDILMVETIQSALANLTILHSYLLTAKTEQ